MKRYLLSLMAVPLFAFCAEESAAPEVKPEVKTPQPSEVAKKAETDRAVEKMEHERATRPPVKTEPAQLKHEDPQARMDRLKEESEQAGGSEAERLGRYKKAREQAEAEDNARKQHEEEQKVKPSIVQNNK